MHENTEKRRQDLLNRYYFQCKCFKCMDNATDEMKSSLLCPVCNGCVPSATSICNSCNLEINNLVLDQYHNLKKQLLNIISKPASEKSVLTYENLYNKAVTLFHPYDKDFMKFLNNYQSKLCQAGHYPRCLDVTRLMLINRYFSLE